MGDDRLRQHIRDIEETAEPDAQFADDLYRRLGAGRTAPRGWTRPRVAATAGVLVLAVVVGLGIGLFGGAGGVGEQVVSPTASGSPAATATPDASPSMSAEPTAAPTSSPSPRPTEVPLPTPLPGSWRSAAQMPLSSRIADATIGPDGRIHVWVLGDAETPVRVYDPVANRWSLEAPTNLPGETIGGWGYGDEQDVATGHDGRIYMTQGVAGPEFYLFAYDPGSRAWEEDPALQHGDFVFDAASGGDGTIYLLVAPSPGRSQIVAFDPESRTLTRGGTIDATLDLLTATGDGRLIATSRSGGTTAEYDLAASTWHPLGALPPVVAIAADTHRLYVLTPELTVLVFDAAFTWVPIMQPPDGTEPVRLLLDADGVLYAFGGPSGQVAVFAPE